MLSAKLASGMNQTRSILGRVVMNENALIWAKIKRTLARKGIEAAILELQRIRSEQTITVCHRF